MITKTDDFSLLIISPHYLTFIKEQTEHISEHIQNIIVVVPYNRISQYMENLPLKKATKKYRKYSKNKLLDTRTNTTIKIYPVPISYMSAPSSNPHFGEKLYKVIDKKFMNMGFMPNMIHAHFTWPSGYVAVKLGKKYGIPVVITAHGYDIYDLPFRSDWWKNKISWILNNADYVITVSRSNLEYIHKLGVKTPVTVIPNGFDDELFHPMDKKECRKKLNLPQNRKILLSVGNLVKVKNHEMLIEVMAKIIKTRDDVLLVIVGSGPLEKSLKSKIKELNLDKYIQLVGGKPHEEIPCWMNAADLFILPSLKEGNPTVMFEALGVGLPFIGTAVGGVPEIIHSENIGLLCIPNNLLCLTDKILVALNKMWDRTKITEYSKNYTWKNLANELKNIYENVILSKR